MIDGQSVILEDIVNLLGMTEDRLTSNMLNTFRINMNKIFNYIDAVNYGKMAIFFTKPDLNLFSDNKYTVNKSIVNNCPDLHAKINANPMVAAQLQSSLSPEGTVGGLGFINMLGGRCNSVDVPEITLSLKEGPKNSKEQGIKYGGDFFESMNGDNFNISFVDDRYANVKTMIEIWLEYIEGVNNGTIDPKITYIGENRLDYAISIYIFALDEIGNIMNSVSLVGCFPTGTNMQLAQYSPLALEADKFLGPFTYPFQFTYITKPNSNRVYEAFNYVSGWRDGIKFKDGQESYEYMYQKTDGWWIHNGHIHLNAFLPHSTFPYSFDLYNFWAQMAGISYNVNSGGVLQYTLLYASKTFKHQKGKQWFEFYNNPLPIRKAKTNGKDQYLGTWLTDDGWEWKWNGKTYYRSKIRNNDPHGNKYINMAGHDIDDQTLADDERRAGHIGYNPGDYGHIQFEEKPIGESNNPKLTNLNRFNAEYQYLADSQWKHHGFDGFGKWSMENDRYGDPNGGSNAQYALQLINNISKWF